MYFTNDENKHRRLYVCLGLRITLTPRLSCRFPLTQAARGPNGNGVQNVASDRVQSEAVQSTEFWVMVIIPINEAGMFTDAVLQNLMEFWNAEVMEIAAIDGSGESNTAPRRAANGRFTLMTVVLNRALIAQQHPAQIQPDGIEMDDGIRLTLRPVDAGREAIVTIGRKNELFCEHRVVKVKPNSYEMRDTSGDVTGTIHKTTEGALPLTDARGRVIRRLSAEDALALFRSSNRGDPSIPISVSYFPTPLVNQIEWGEIHSQRQLQRMQISKGERS